MESARFPPPCSGSREICPASVGIAVVLLVGVVSKRRSRALEAPCYVRRSVTSYTACSTLKRRGGLSEPAASATTWVPVRIEPPEGAACGDEGVHHRGTLAAIVGAGEQP